MLDTQNHNNKTIMSFDCDFGEQWILSDSRNAQRHLRGWSSANDETSVSVLVRLRKISKIHDGHLQRIPSHVNSGITC
ncbi:hypothetical protein TNIN_27301 [Trichonephila inaurata madagascariensis]|uniref:Uncharacterized protein n=1 Tax=Trichonephila inaurata madagascariensis TaxID=2747483 RepID=A0A8X7CAE9_9ARAC|nr:hypothetical protein TNIN_27301 [Trichonephila inaurata madagascariensis]